MVKVSRPQELTDLLLGSVILGMLLLVAVSGAFLWLARWDVKEKAIWRITGIAAALPHRGNARHTIKGATS
jgi:hypothetical protein